jgi:hypothetical protein
MISKRYALLLAIVDALKGITTTNGFEENVRKVYKGRTEFGEQEKDYFLSVVEDLDHRDKKAVRDDMEWHVIPFLVQGFVKEESNGGFERAYQLLAEVQKVLRPEKTGLFGKTATKVSIEPGSVVRPLDGTGSDFLFVMVRLNITIAEDFEPYNN